MEWENETKKERGREDERRIALDLFVRPVASFVYEGKEKEWRWRQDLASKAPAAPKLKDVSPMRWVELRAGLGVARDHKLILCLQVVKFTVLA